MYMCTEMPDALAGSIDVEAGEMQPMPPPRSPIDQDAAAVKYPEGNLANLQQVMGMRLQSFYVPVLPPLPTYVRTTLASEV